MLLRTLLRRNFYLGSYNCVFTFLAIIKILGILFCVKHKILSFIRILVTARGKFTDFNETPLATPLARQMIFSSTINLIVVI